MMGGALTGQRTKTSVIIVNLAKADMTCRCVETVLRHSDPDDIEILVVDNGSNGDARAATLLQLRLGPAVRVIPLERNRFFGEANNIGAEQARHPHIVFLNNDAFVTKGWLAAMSAALAPGVGAVVPMLLNPDGTVQELGSSIAPDGSNTSHGRLSPPTPEQVAEVRQVQFGSAACMILRKQDFLDAGGFHFRYEPAYYEDADLCLRLKLKGLVTVCAPQARVIHLENQTSRTPAVFGRSAVEDITRINRKKFVDLWGEHLSNGPDAPAPHLSATPDNFCTPVLSILPSHTAPCVAVELPDSLEMSFAMFRQLRIAMRLAQERNVVLLTRHPVSALRISALCAEMGIDWYPVALASAFPSASVPSIISLITVDAGSCWTLLLPAIRRVHVIDMNRAAAIVTDTTLDAELLPLLRAGVAEFVLESHEGRATVLALATRFGLPAPAVHVIATPVPALPAPQVSSAATGQLRIVAAGRFTGDVGGQRYDQLIEAVRVLHAMGREIDVHFVGSVPARDGPREQYLALTHRAEGLPIRFGLDLPCSAFRAVLAADVVWYAPAGGAWNPALATLGAIQCGAWPIVLASRRPADFPPDCPLVSNFQQLAEVTAQWRPGTEAPGADPIGPLVNQAAMMDAFAARWAHIVGR